mgnify:CR=1 FL=1
MGKEDLATLTLSEDGRKLFITTRFMQQAYEAGSILIDFLEMDYDAFSMKYLWLSGICDTNNIILTNEFDMSKEIQRYEDVKKEFIEAAHVCFDTKLDDRYGYIEKGNIQQRYAYYTLKANPSFENDLNIGLKLATCPTPHIDNKEISPKAWIEKIRDAGEKESAEFILTTQPRFVDSYWFYSLADIMYFELINAVKGNILIKRCENCKRYFVPSGRNDALYCKRIAPGSEKTCVEIGAIKKYEKQIESNPIRKAYRMEYKKRYARVLKRAMNKTDFFDWSEKMRMLRDEALDGKISYENFIEKLRA